MTWGELFQNNHHARAMSPNFAARWFELDPTWPIIRVLSWLRIITLPTPARSRRASAAEDAAPVPT